MSQVAASFSNLEFIDHPSPCFTDRRGNGYPQFLVLHYTACPFERSLHLLTTKVSAHYLVDDTDTKIYRLVDETKRAWHAGKAYWAGTTDVNSFSIGIEIVNIGYSYGCPLSQPPRYTGDYLVPYLLSSLVRKVWDINMHFQRNLGEKGWLGKKTWHRFFHPQIDC